MRGLIQCLPFGDWLISFTTSSSRFIHVVAGLRMFLFPGRIIFHSVYFVYLFTRPRTRGLFSPFDKCCYERGHVNVSEFLLSILLGIIPEAEVLGHMVISCLIF